MTLTNLPVDYDVGLYNNSGKRLKLSQNGGTTSETIIYNTNSVGTYYIQVYGYNGANSASQCYSLLAQISSNSFRETDAEDVTDIETQESSLSKIYPNPASDLLMVEFFSAAESDITIDIIDLTGRVVSAYKETVMEGENIFKVNTSNLTPGIYLLRLTDDMEQSHHQRLLISR